QRGLEAGRLRRRETAGPDDVDQLRQRRLLDGIPVRRSGEGQPRAAPAGTWFVDLVRKTRGIRRPERDERLLGVDVGAVLGEDREDELRRRIEAAAPDLRAVQVAERIERVIEQARPVA